MNNSPDTSENAADRAVSERLAELRARPIDSAAFDAKFKALVPPPASDSPQRSRWMIWPARAVAACALVGLVSLAFIAFLSQPVMATPVRMAQVYEETVAGRGHTTPVRTIDEARAVLRGQWTESPLVPETVDDMQVMSCCVHEVGRQRMACVTFTVDDSLVTMAMAPSKEIKTPGGETRVVGDRRYVVHSENGVNMAMSEQHGTWVCVMGRLPIDRLIEIARSASE
jgi:hypothetical protein